jgi:hypothetical protein
MASSLHGASDTALSEQILDAAQAETELHCQHALRHARSELLDQSLHILIRQPIPHPPEPGSPAADAGVVRLSLSVASFRCTPASLLKAFLQVRAVRATSDKLQECSGETVSIVGGVRVPRIAMKDCACSRDHVGHPDSARVRASPEQAAPCPYAAHRSFRVDVMIGLKDSPDLHINHPQQGRPAC